jgi:3,2-trans-enoyl-CoA isomerase
MCCDIRVATEHVVMGLNEVQLGISVPFLWTKLMATLIGHGKMEKLVQFATMVPSKEGIKIGLVDHVVESKSQLLPTSTAFLKKVRSRTLVF